VNWKQYGCLNAGVDLGAWRIRRRWLRARVRLPVCVVMRDDSSCAAVGGMSVVVRGRRVHVCDGVVKHK